MAVEEVTPLAPLPPDHDIEHLHRALEFVTDFSIAVDGGAHTGAWTRVMAERFERVYAFEPVYHARIAHSDKITVLRAALGHCAISVGMSPGPENEGQHHVNLAGATHAMIPLDAIHLRSCGLLKLDVEGFEFNALCGARRTIRDHKPVIVVEVNGLGVRYGCPDYVISDMLTGMSYQLRDTLNKDQIWTPTLSNGC